MGVPLQGTWARLLVAGESWHVLAYEDGERCGERGSRASNLDGCPLSENELGRARD